MSCLSLTKDELKAIVDEYGLDAHKQKTDEMIETTIAYFEQSQKYVEEGEVVISTVDRSQNAAQNLCIVDILASRFDEGSHVFNI